MSDIVVVGAGMVGAAAALALARSGHRVTVLEKAAAAEFNNDSDYGLRVSAISPASAELLDQLGLWPRVLTKRHCAYREMRVWDGQGEGQIHFVAGEYGLSALGTIVENELLQAELWAGMRDEANIEIVIGDAWQEFENGSRNARLGLVSGRELTADCVVAADGAKSKLREHMGTAWRGQSYCQTAVVANISSSASHMHTAWQRFFEQDVLAFLPLADGRCSIVWSTPQANAERLLELSDDDFLMELNVASGQCLGTVTGTGQRAAFPLQAGIAESWVKSRTVLIGDAAHSIHPLAGQGVNLGFGDVAALVAAIQDGVSHNGLRRYERSRKAANLKMIAGVDGLQKLFSQQYPATQWLRATGLNAVNNLPPLKHWFAKQSIG